MRIRVTQRRRTFALSMLLLVMALMDPWALNQSSAQAQAGTATITVHDRTCPAGYGGENYYRDCHNRFGPATDFHLLGATTAERSSGPDGNVSFGSLLPGHYALFRGTPSDDVAHWFFCADSDAPGVAVPFDELGSGASTGIGIVLAAGDHIICDWYTTLASVDEATTVPSTAYSTTTVFINVWGCPRAYPHEIEFAACLNPWAQQNLRFSNGTTGDTWKTVMTGTDGLAVITLTYRTDSYHVTTDLPSFIGWYKLICLDHNRERLAVSYDRVGAWLSGLADSSEVVCDLFLIPAPLADDEPRG